MTAEKNNCQNTQILLIFCLFYVISGVWFNLKKLDKGFKMPSFSRADNKLDKDFFKELQEKCAYLGISLSEKEFKRDPDKYLAAAREYDGRVKSYLFDNRERMQELQNKFAAEDNMPAFMAMGKARQTLISELHRQMLAEKTAQAGLNAANDKEIRQMATAMAAYTHENKNADEFIRTAGEKSQPAAAKAEKDIPLQTDGKNEKARRRTRQDLYARAGLAMRRPHMAGSPSSRKRN